MENKNDFLKLVKKHLEDARNDLKACPRGINHGRVAALEKLYIEALELVNV